MKKRHLMIVIVSSILFLNVYTGLALAQTNSTVQQTNNLAKTVNQQIYGNFLETPMKTGNQLVAQGYADDDKFPFSGSIDYYYALENVLAINSLELCFEYQDLEGAADWASANILQDISDIFSSATTVHGFREHSDSSSEGARDTFLQFLAMDQLSSYYERTKDSIYSKLNDLFNAREGYEANNTPGYSGYPQGSGAYWTALDGYYKDTTYTNCRANVSLMAAVGLSRFALALPEADDEDGSKKAAAIYDAEMAMSWADSYCFQGGFYKESDTDSSDNVHVITQAYALRAYASLYRATKKQSYLWKADALIRKIMESFWDPGRGGVMETYDTSTGTVVSDHADGPIKSAYSNAWFALACAELYKVSGNTQYLGVAKDTMNFMYNYLWSGVGGSVMGYDEWCLRNGTKITPDQYSHLDPSGAGSYAKFIKTNVIAMQVNAEITWEIRPWYVEYMLYLIIGGGVAIAVIMAAILIGRRRRLGTKLPKGVKGLLGED